MLCILQGEYSSSEYLAVSMEARGGHKCQRSMYSLSGMYVHGGFGVISWSGQAATLWANYLSFKHINNGNLKNMSVY
jgi:hypothetical protein